VELGSIQPEEVAVEAIIGPLDGHGEIQRGVPIPLDYDSSDSNGASVFRGSLPCRRSGRNGFTVRIIPTTKKVTSNRFETRLITWWGDATATPQQPMGASHGA
jgi:starch phosphorylase